MKICLASRNTRVFLSVIALAVCRPAFTQELLELNIGQRCIFTGGKMDEELYRFGDDSSMIKRVEEIVTLGGAEFNFEVVQTNVENVSAVLDGEKRYLLYSLDFVQKATEIEITGALAHEIGHHANEHTFDQERRNTEETEADQFMGYIFSLKNYSRRDIEEFLKKTPSSYGIPVEERLRAVLEGFGRAERALQINSLAFDGDPRLAELTMPGFPWPPPACNARFELPEVTLGNVQTLGQADRKLRSALNAKGYTQHSYFSVPGGFAIVTQLEQYNGEDGSSRNDRTRWLDYPARENFDGVMAYLKSFVMPQKGQFRLFVFIVTNQPFGGNANRVSKEQASAWLGQGFNKLPNNVARVSFSADFNISALVYEFEVPESNRKPVQRCPTPRFDARTHLAKSGLLAELASKATDVLPSFTFYQCYSNFEVSNDIFGNLGTLGRVDEKIRLALDKCGYTQRSYFSVKNGFAIVTQMEQYNKDGSCRKEPGRWHDNPARSQFKDVLDYFQSIVVPNKGLFRVFAFVVTDASFTASEQPLSKEEAAAWSGKGANRLPKAIADIIYSKYHQVSVLVYEFEVPETNKKPLQRCPKPKFDSKNHLDKSGISAALGL